MSVYPTMSKITEAKVFILKPNALMTIGFGQNVLWDTPYSGIVQISTDDGVDGNYIASAGDLEEFMRHLAADRDVIIGADPFDREGIEKRLAKRRWTNSILSVLDICVWDILGKTLKHPIYKLLGAYRDKIMAYASGVAGAIGGSRNQIDIALECKRKGFRALKVHPSQQSWKKDIELCKAVREAVGEEMILMFDPYSHEHYDRETALKVGRAIEHLGFYWYEDPLPTNDYYGLSELCRLLDVKMMIGEYVSGLDGYKMLIERRATDSLRCVDGLVGGISAMMKVSHLAEAFNMKCEPHSYGPTLMQAAHLHIMLSNENCDFFESPVPEAFYEKGMKDAIRIDDDGFVHAPRKPGLGYDIDWDFVRENTLRMLPEQ